MDIQMTIEPDKMYSLSEAFKFSPVKSFQTFRRYADAGQLKTLPRGNGYAVRGSDLIEFLSKHGKVDFNK